MRAVTRDTSCTPRATEDTATAGAGSVFTQGADTSPASITPVSPTATGRRQQAISVTSRASIIPDNSLGTQTTAAMAPPAQLMVVMGPLASPPCPPSRCPPTSPGGRHRCLPGECPSHPPPPPCPQSRSAAPPSLRLGAPASPEAGQ